VPQLYHPVAEVDLGEGVERHLRHPPPGDRVKQPLIAIHVAGPDLLLVPQVGRVVLVDPHKELLADQSYEGTQRIM
jgi:hypothetical protein